jgi:molecular chaperone DnaK (HSP70)
MSKSRYIVGIDLGTTNSVVSYIDTEETFSGAPRTRIMKVPQVTEAGVVEGVDSLPSFLYIPAESELPEKSLALPWAGDMPYTVGTFARKRGAEVPLRLVASAKSWLCYPNVDKTAPILPWNAPEGVAKMSPLDVSSRYLKHIRHAWNLTVAEGKSEYFLGNQDVYITVPASFDAVARDLTVKAAERAGLHSVTLLEEPQAAFYAWINGEEESWRDQVTVGDVVLVCDIGGGTTDFSIIKVEDQEGELALSRVAVGEHILLGGDNMDLTLAYAVQKHFAEKNIKLDTKQMLGLIYSCREAKEQMLNDRTIASRPIVILGRGRSVIGGTLETELSREEIEETIINGFFPQCSVDDAPVRRKAAGLRELGLQYAADTAVTRYLAKFLRQNAGSADASQHFIQPTKIIFNGGVTKAQAISERLIDVLNQWLSAEGAGSLTVLQGTSPDTAVAAGAACYGYAKREQGIRIRAGAGRSYYIGIEASMPAVPGMAAPLKAICVVPFGMEEGADFRIPGQEFGLVVGEQALFRFLSSLVRRDDAPGTVIDTWEDEEIHELAPLETTLPAGETDAGTVVPVKLHSYLNEVGVLELWCEASDGSGRWKLEFDVREDQNG